MPRAALRRLHARVHAFAMVWTRPRDPEPLPARLDRRRIYVLPTRFGLFYGAALLTMLLGALNYNNNPALLLGLLLEPCAPRLAERVMMIRWWRREARRGPPEGAMQLQGFARRAPVVSGLAGRVADAGTASSVGQPRSERRLEML